MQRICLSLAALILIGAEGCRSKHGAGPVSAKTAPLWSAETGAPVPGTELEVAPDGTVYVGGSVDVKTTETAWPDVSSIRQPCLLAFDPDGKMKLKLLGTASGGFNPQPPPLHIVMSAWGSVFAVDESGGLYGMVPSGDTHFHQVKDARLYPPGALGPGNLLYVGGTGGLRGYGIETSGDPLASFVSLGRDAYSPVASPDGRLYFRDSGRGGLTALEASGEVVSLGIRDGGKFLVDSEGNLVVWWPESKMTGYHRDGRTLWTFERNERIFAPVAGLGGVLYVVNQQGVLRAIQNGNPLWAMSLDERPKTHPTLGPDGTIYVLSLPGTVFAVDPSGKQRFALALGRPDGQAMAVSPDGRVYILADDRRLYAFAAPQG